MQLQELNKLSAENLKKELTKCCGASAWVEKMAMQFPFATVQQLYDKAAEVWTNLEEKDWLEAFEHHPKIGDVNSLKQKFAGTASWAAGEQASVQLASGETIEELASLNKKYEEKFGYIFIVCAMGKSAEEMLRILESRLPNEAGKELQIAAGEQAKITRVRLEKLLA
jgi:2-oxo-4-hydroxy-4-carboxy-5-ureidoimidazoline decarboxylase